MSPPRIENHKPDMTNNATAPRRAARTVGGGRVISQQHLDMLAKSGITAELAELRGYETIRDPRRLAALGYPKAAQRTSGLLIPQHTARGDVWGYAYRPDHPRERNGKKAKYEMPYRQANHIDVPVGVGPMLADPGKTLLITEGSKKADCAALHNLCCVSINGVAGWRSTNAAGGKTAVADFNDIALNGRQVSAPSSSPRSTARP